MKPDTTVDELTQRNVNTIAKIEQAANHQRSQGDRVADMFAHTIGSWRFIIIQTVILIIWMILNVTAWMKHWDPYPFILLNLALSFQSAYAGPILMMSQNRQARLTERLSHLDLQINLLAEQENTEMLRLLRMLCEKHGLAIQDDPSIAVLEQATEPEVLIHQIEETEAESAEDDNPWSKHRREKH